MKRMTIVRVWIAISVAFSFVDAHAQNISMTTPSEIVPVEPGAHVDIPIVITNQGTESWGEPSLGAFVFPADYTAEDGPQPACGPFAYDQLGAPSATLTPMAPGERRTCVVRISRNADAINNTFLIWRAYTGTGDSWSVTMTLGTFVDVGFGAALISSEVDTDNVRHAIYTVSAHNDGAVPVDNVLMGLGTVCTIAPVQVDTDLPGGCRSDEVGCQFTGGPGAAVRFPVLAPGATQSCRVRLSAPNDLSITEQVYLAPDRITNATTGGRISDTGDSNNHFVLSLSGPTGQPPAVEAPVRSPWSLLLLTVLVAGAALRTMLRALNT